MFSRLAYRVGMDASQIIDALGGTTAVARLCECEPPSVSEWRRKGIPKARLLYLKAIRPDVFEEDEHPVPASASPEAA